MTVTPALNQYGTNTITVTVTDGDGATASKTFTLVVTPVNDPPTIGNIANQTINEDTTTEAIAFTVGDVGDGGRELGSKPQFLQHECCSGGEHPSLAEAAGAGR